MTREEHLTGEALSEMAEQSGLFLPIGTSLSRFAALVAAAEREAMRQDGWRCCAVGQGETQHCALLEAAVAAEREACAAICDRLARRYGDGPELEHYQQGFGDGAFLSAEKIRARGQE